MKLKPAHNGAFEENISYICTNRLYREALESLKVAPLPTVSVWITRWVLKEFLGDRNWVEENTRTWWQVLRGVKKESPKSYLSHPKGWELSHYGAFGRKDHKLVVRLQVKWEVDGEGKDGYLYQHTEDGLVYSDRKFHFFTTDIKIFPLTAQQAAFVGAKYFSSTTPNIFWGTWEDVEEIKTKFVIA